jgi:hypothetical protein
MGEQSMTRSFLASGIGAIAAVTILLGADHMTVARAAAPIQVEPGEPAEQFCARVQAAFTREDFDVLESTAERARSLATWLQGGKAELQVFYASFSEEHCTQYYAFVSDPVAKARIAVVEHWLQQKPNSLTAKLASAIMWDQYAWTGRGTGFADAISQEQWALFRERAQYAAQFMRNVDPARDAQAYIVLLNLARDLSQPRARIDAIYSQARTQFPTYQPYYTIYANLIQPKWFGAPGEIANFTQSLLSDPGGDTGTVAYARVAERLAWDFWGSDIYREFGLTWADVQHSFAVRERLYGLDQWARIALCYYAVAAGDRDAAREAFRHITHLEYWPNGGRGVFYLTVLPWIMSAD